MDRYLESVDVQSDITRMAFRDASFDLIVCSHVLEHIPDDLAAMREVLRVCKPGGTAILNVPYEPGSKTFEDPSITTPEERRRAFGQADHVRVYSGTDYISRLESCGWHVSHVDYVNGFTDKERKLYALPTCPDDRCIFRCEYRA
jgi:SAM-dependent methyltransferase